MTKVAAKRALLIDRSSQSTSDRGEMKIIPCEGPKDRDGLQCTADTPMAVIRGRQIHGEGDEAGEPEDHGGRLGG